MSKFIKAGEVWGNDDYRYHVLFVSENAVRCMTIVHGFHLFIMVWDKDLFVRQFTRIGESKIDVIDLFEVKDE